MLCMPSQALPPQSEVSYVLRCAVYVPKTCLSMAIRGLPFSSGVNISNGGRSREGPSLERPLAPLPQVHHEQSSDAHAGSDTHACMHV